MWAPCFPIFSAAEEKESDGEAEKAWAFAPMKASKATGVTFPGSAAAPRIFFSLARPEHRLAIAFRHAPHSQSRAPPPTPRNLIRTHAPSLECVLANTHANAHFRRRRRQCMHLVVSTSTTSLVARTLAAPLITMASKEFLTRTLAARGFLAWITQLLASCAWVASVFIYGGWELGDRLQLVAALSWTVSNAFAAPEAILPLLTAPEEQVAVEVRSVKSEA